MTDIRELNRPWEWWAEQWRLKQAGQQLQQISESSPHAGFFRWVKKAGYGGVKWAIPVAYYPLPNGSNELGCRIAGEGDVEPQRGRDIWINVGMEPVDQEWYRDVAERNKPQWEDGWAISQAAAGSNLPAPESGFDTIRDSITDLAAKANEWLKKAITNQNEANEVSDLSGDLLKLHKLVEEKRKEEQKPFDEGLLAVREKWRPLREDCELASELKKKVLTPWHLKEEARLKAEAEAASAAGQPAPSKAPRARSGTRGKAMSTHTYKFAEIVDWDACLQAFKDNPEIKATLQDCANRAVRSGLTVPGVKVREEKQVV